MRRIEIFDTTLRDAEQVPGAKLNPDEKLTIARQLARLSVDAIEAGFPVSSQGDFEAVRRIAAGVDGPTIVALARARREDIESAAAALEPVKKGRIHVFLSASDVQIETLLRKTREEALQMAVEAVRLAKSFREDVEFSPMDATRADFGFLCRMVEATIEAGATVVNIPDTVGYALPDEFGELIASLRRSVPNIERARLSVHCHNDLGMATATSLAAVMQGAQQVECTINGLGERAGNAALEEIVCALHVRRPVLKVETGVKMEEIMRTSRLVSSLMGIPIQPNKAIVGANAFAHSSGVHQDGILKDRRNFEIVRPEDVGAAAHRLVLTARSGRHALKHRLHELGFALSDEQFNDVYRRFLDLADRKKEVEDEDLYGIMENALQEVRPTFTLESFRLEYDEKGLPLATVQVNDGQSSRQSGSTGDGPVAAAYQAIDKVTGKEGRVLDFHLRARTGGREAVGEAVVKVQFNDLVILGRANHTDILRASIDAYLNAVNRYVAVHGRNASSGGERE